MNSMRKIVMIAAAVVIAAALSACVKLWEQERIETIPLPETEIPVTPDPWEPGGDDEIPVL